MAGHSKIPRGPSLRQRCRAINTARVARPVPSRADMTVRVHIDGLFRLASTLAAARHRSAAIIRVDPTPSAAARPRAPAHLRRRGHRFSGGSHVVDSGLAA